MKSSISFKQTDFLNCSRQSICIPEMSKSFQHPALLARKWNPSHLRANEQIDEFTKIS
jgi:hypothetical protein